MYKVTCTKNAYGDPNSGSVFFQGQHLAPGQFVLVEEKPEHLNERLRCDEVAPADLPALEQSSEKI